MLAIVEAYKSGLFKTKYWLPNITSGIIVGIVAIPLAMAFAISSGVKPEQGLYTAIIASVIVAILGGSRVQIAGPTGAFVVILAGITAKYGIEGLQIATLLSGLILIAMGLFKLGNVIKFIPTPVIVGFTSGIGFIIFFNELRFFFGLNLHSHSDHQFHLKFLYIIQKLPYFNHNTTLMAIFSLLIIIGSSRLFKRIPGALIALFITGSLQYNFNFEHIATLGSSFGALPQHFPSLTMPNISFTRVVELIGPSFTIALLGAIESLLSATAADGMLGTRHNSNQELIGQGLANMVVPLFGGFAATGAIARTATNIRNGGNSPLAAIFHAITLIFVLVFLAPYANYIPLCTLAAILFVVAYNMSDIPYVIYIIKHASYHDVIVLLITFFLTVFTDLVIAVNVGVILSMFFFTMRMHQEVSITKDQDEEEIVPSDNVIVYSIQGPFFFAAAKKIETSLSDINLLPKTIIFRLKSVPFIDITGLETFAELIEQYRKHNVKIYLCEANKTLAKALSKLNILDMIEGNKIYHNITEVKQVSSIK